MGTWGSGIFQNDDALDLIGKLCEGDNLDVAVRLLCTVASTATSDWRVGDLAQEALAAAEVIAAAGGRPPPDLPPEARVWLGRRSITLDAAIVACALSALPRVRANFEYLRDYWAEAERFEQLPLHERDNFEPQFRQIDDLDQRLRSVEATLRDRRS
jgi:hypothetical protein